MVDTLLWNPPEGDLQAVCEGGRNGTQLMGFTFSLWSKLKGILDAAWEENDSLSELPPSLSVNDLTERLDTGSGQLPPLLTPSSFLESRLLPLKNQSLSWFSGLYPLCLPKIFACIVIASLLLH